MTDMIEYIPKRHGQRPPYWTPDTLTGLDNKNYVRQPNWAWIAGTTYYVPYEAVHGVPRLAPVDADAEPVDPQDIIKALQAENAKLRDALFPFAEFHQLGGSMNDPISMWFRVAPFADAAYALQETER